MQVVNVVGARPNLMKIAPLIESMNLSSGIEQTLIHTGQHYDEKMSQVFFEELNIPKPDVYLGIGSGSHAEQTARAMLALEPVLLERQPNIVIVVGDVNSTLAAAITSAKLDIPVAHIEAGLRSFDRTMPEEINRIVTDALSDLLFTTSRDASRNVRNEGIAEEKIFFVGNVMIDTLEKYRPKARNLNTASRFGLRPEQYALLTLHRPSNVDQPRVLEGILDALVAIQREIPIIFPAHPRTVQRIEDFDLEKRLDAALDLQIIEPLGYLAFLDLMMHARLVLTDSGGIQEETTILGIPCLTLRENTERPVTVKEGTNSVIGTDPNRIIRETQHILDSDFYVGKTPELWDGHAAARIVDILCQHGSL